MTSLIIDDLTDSIDFVDVDDGRSAFSGFGEKISDTGSSEATYSYI